jgi:hypothetical protein
LSVLANVSFEPVAAVQPMSEFFHPKLQAVSALEPYRLSTTWSTGEVLEVDVSNVMRGTAFAKIRKPEVFARFTPTDQASSGLIPSSGPTMFTPGPKSKQARSVMRCSGSGCTATSFLFPVPPMRWASAVAW